MHWFVLVVAGLAEVGWASLLPATANLTRPLPTFGFLALLAVSMLGLARAVEAIPLGTAYAVWVGIGVLGATLVGVVAHGDPASPARLGFLALLVVSVVGLKVTGGA